MKTNINASLDKISLHAAYSAKDNYEYFRAELPHLTDDQIVSLCSTASRDFAAVAVAQQLQDIAENLYRD